MLYVQTSIKVSSIHGIGLFAANIITKGTLVWRFELGFDQVFTRDQVAAFPKKAQIYFAKYGYLSSRTGRYILDADDGRFFNHADQPNTSTKTLPDSEEYVLCANHDIMQGEELTLNYEEQERYKTEGNIIDEIYAKYELVDELDPRLKKKQAPLV